MAPEGLKFKREDGEKVATGQFAVNPARLGHPGWADGVGGASRADVNLVQRPARARSGVQKDDFSSHHERLRIRGGRPPLPRRYLAAVVEGDAARIIAVGVVFANGDRVRSQCVFAVLAVPRVGATAIESTCRAAAVARDGRALVVDGAIEAR